MTNHSKQLSNSFSTGGGGYNFETRVQASFVTLMLSGGFAPALPAWPIIRIKLQGKYAGYDTDDAIVFVQGPDGKSERKLLCQIKHFISITDTNKKFGEVIQAAWNDFNNPKIFTKGKDSIALITGPLSATDIADVRSVLEKARHCESSADFLTQVNRAKFSSKKKIQKLGIFRKHLKHANGGNTLSDEALWGFMKNFHLLGYDLDIKAGVTLSLVHSLIGQYSPSHAQSLWAQILDEVQSKNQSAGTIKIESLSEDIQNAFKKPGVETAPATLGIKPTTILTADWNASRLAIANLLGAWDENV